MYNDRNRQMPNGAYQFPMANRLGGDIPRLDSDQGGRRCDGTSLDRTSCDQVLRDRAIHDQALEHAQRGQVNDRTSCGCESRERGSCNRTTRDCNDRNDRNERNDHKLREYVTNGHWKLHSHPLAMVYPPYQHFREIYTPDTALDRGTLFSELDLPFEGSNNRRNGGCAR